jgi:galactose mutarotase-like enzyme
MHIIENEFLKVKAREFGAELTSILDKRTGIEHLWQADEHFWGWHAPVLFPVVGRCLNDSISVGGRNYPMEKHGFTRKSTFKLLELGLEKMVFTLTASNETRAHYPFNFTFLIGYHLRGNSLVCNYEVVNTDNGDIYFSLGGHPAFAVPFFSGDVYEDYYLEFELEEHAERHFIDSDGFFDGTRETVLPNARILPLSASMFNKDAYIFKQLQSRAVTIKTHKHDQQLTVRFAGFNYLGIWAKANAPFVCIEPWLGCADTAGRPMDFSRKEDIVTLAASDKFCRSIIIEVGK